MFNMSNTRISKKYRYQAVKQKEQSKLKKKKKKMYSMKQETCLQVLLSYKGL